MKYKFVKKIDENIIQIPEQKLVHLSNPPYQ